MRQFICVIIFVAVVIAADSLSQESAEKKGGEDSFTVKIPIESVAIAQKKVGEDKVNVATATKLAVKHVEGSPSQANLPTISVETTTKSIKLVKVPTEEIAIAHKELGGETQVATATKATIVAIEKESRARRDANFKSMEAADSLKEKAVDLLTKGDHNPAVAPVEDSMTAVDPIKVEAKPVVRARRFA
uniref:Uncharacterized protein n=1 Tax=Panagrolaimus superbus TaxID=310955 RepID=A0A914YRV7_9BILA